MKLEHALVITLKYMYPFYLLFSFMAKLLFFLLICFPLSLFVGLANLALVLIFGSICLVIHKRYARPFIMVIHGLLAFLVALDFSFYEAFQSPFSLAYFSIPNFSVSSFELYHPTIFVIVFLILDLILVYVSMSKTSTLSVKVSNPRVPRVMLVAGCVLYLSTIFLSFDKGGLFSTIESTDPITYHLLDVGLFLFHYEKPVSAAGTAVRSEMEDSIHPYSWVNPKLLIAHAMGGIDEKTYTNSLEAFKQNYEKGYRVFEVDLIVTSDAKVVARHDWSLHSYEKLEQNHPRKLSFGPLHSEEFQDLKIHSQYTPLSFEDIVQLMTEYDDIYLVTDTKGTHPYEIKNVFRQIVDASVKTDPTILERIIPQIYNEMMYYVIQDVYPFQDIIYTLYKTNASDERVLQFCLDNKIKAVTMSKSRYSKEFAEQLSSNHIYTFVHTINNKEKSMEYFKSGVTGLYSDFLTPEQ
ncbi:phosphatidylinositol-specific phospholipase C/glycerophosphodiester phosphodiesterase family protein [Bacillus salitolerans]|uniref:Phosphatidylinositol-specific phospholipase C/glycerophosphodiester phosphodiesterase family protein n=1 Tax=Bacillus salitolerans TaxID=1437434 RepID=A0ABW4LWK9_9BACI